MSHLHDAAQEAARDQQAERHADFHETPYPARPWGYLVAETACLCCRTDRHKDCDGGTWQGKDPAMCPCWFYDHQVLP